MRGIKRWGKWARKLEIITKWNLDFLWNDGLKFEHERLKGQQGQMLGKKTDFVGLITKMLY